MKISLVYYIIHLRLLAHILRRSFWDMTSNSTHIWLDYQSIIFKKVGILLIFPHVRQMTAFIANLTFHLLNVTWHRKTWSRSGFCGQDSLHVTSTIGGGADKWVRGKIMRFSWATCNILVQPGLEVNSSTNSALMITKYLLKLHKSLFQILWLKVVGCSTLLCEE